MENVTQYPESVIDRLVKDKRQAIKDAKKNLQKPEYQEALHKLRIRNEARGTTIVRL